MRRTLSRRSLLRGAGGTAVALPLLESMLDRRAFAQGGARPPRYFVAFAGSSIANRVDHYTPKKVGRGYEATIGLRPLAGRSADPTQYPWDSLLGEFAVVSNLKIPWESGAPGGRPATFHSSSPGPLLCGVRARNAVPDCAGPTSDELVAASSKDKLRFRALHYRVQLERYRTSYGGNKGYMSYRAGAGGVVEPNTPIVSPRIAYDQLFQGFTPAAPGDASARLRAIEEDRSVLDLVRGSGARLMKRLGAEDQRRMQRHFDEIRELERRVAEAPQPVAAATCRTLPDPGKDPGALADLENSYAAGRPVGYAGEEERARVLVDIVHMAFTCDLARVATLMFTYAMSFMSVERLIGKKVDLHDLGHGGGNDQNIAEGLAWHVKHVAALADKLRRTPEGDGNLLDRSVLVLVNEGGVGFDPEQNHTSSTHSTDNMTVLIGGRAGGLLPGQHIVTAKKHPASVLISAMRAAGLATDQLGEVRGGINELFA